MQALRPLNTKVRLVAVVAIFVLEFCWSAETNIPLDWTMIGDFNLEWHSYWKERVLAERSNHYQIVEEAGNRILKITSNRSASGFWREWRIEPMISGRIRWRWKVEASLTENKREREKKGDDFAARVFVVFEPHFFNWKTKSICYVWAGNEPVGSVYKNPYSDSVGQIVLQSGGARVGEWVNEERDFVADYRQYFGKIPTRVSAFAVMVDTDNTGGRTTSWFDDMSVKINSATAAGFSLKTNSTIQKK